MFVAVEFSVVLISAIRWNWFALFCKCVKYFKKYNVITEV